VDIRPRPSTTKGSAETFTGDVWVDPIVGDRESPRVRVTAVRFAPGARTAWHSHAFGQTLYVTEGAGRIQSRGQALVPIRAGDIVYTPAGEEHWHGASPDHYMTHLSIHEGGGVEHPAGREHVTDAQYHGKADTP
jgi:quercetin dioxygenase-like cupin family protein